MTTENPVQECVTYEKDSPLLVLLFVLLFLGICVGLWLLVRRLPSAILIPACSLGVAILGIVFVATSQSAPTHDSYIVSNAAYLASIGDGTGVGSDYFLRFPFQLGYVLWSELWIRVLGTGDHSLSLQIVNVLCLSGAYAALLLTARALFGDGRALRLCAILCLLAPQPILFCSFTYGTVPGLLFASLAVWQTVTLWESKHPVWRGLAVALSLGIAVALKKNNLILCVAILFVLLLRLFSAKPRDGWQKRLACLVCIPLCVLAVLAIPKGAQMLYETRFELSFGRGIPMSSWAAMGLHDSFIAPGWYDARYTVQLFSECGMDTDETHRRALEVIGTRLNELDADLPSAGRFFSEKIKSQWNEPSFQSIWTNQVRGQYGEKVFPAAWICGRGEALTKGFMNTLVSFVYLFSAVGAIFLLRRRCPEDALIPTWVLGGFLYHTIFEAKSQYILPYFVLLLPLAAFGVSSLIGLVSHLIRLMKRRKKVEPTPSCPEEAEDPSHAVIWLEYGFGMRRENVKRKKWRIYLKNR